MTTKQPNSVKKGVRGTRTEIIESLIFEVWDSLKSHLPYTHKIVKNIRYVSGGKKMSNVEFEVECIKKYAEMIKSLTDLY